MGKKVSCIGLSSIIIQIPPLPKASESVRRSLAECNAHISDIDLFKPSNRSKRRKTTCGRRLNGFLAFRIFYSRAAKDSASQKKLSSLLAKAWSEDVNKHIWSTYASVYNETGGTDEFIPWLEKTLNKTKQQTGSRTTCKTQTNAFINGIEDVYLT